MVPVGGIYTINGEQAKEVVKQIKPRLYVLPMHYGVPGYEDIRARTSSSTARRTSRRCSTRTNSSSPRT